MAPTVQPPVPTFEVHLAAPDIGPWIAGNTGIAGFTERASGQSGPHVALLALVHGNEIGGAIVLDRLLRARLTPRRGKLTFGFVNLAAFERFDPQQPTASRFIDEDMNRLWDPGVLDSNRRSAELDRAREVRPLIDTCDALLDLHSMLWPSDPLILCGPSAKGKQLALGIGVPGLVVADKGHVSGRRIIDYPRFADPTTPYAGSLVEAGQHWQKVTADTMFASVAGFLKHLDLVEHHPALPEPVPQTQRYAEVTTAVTATTSNFVFVQSYRGGDVIARRNT